MQCEKCHAQLKPGYAFCTVCGAPAPQDAPVTQNAPLHPPFPCAFCGMMVPPRSATCLACGKLMVIPEGSAAEAAVPAPRGEEPQATIAQAEPPQLTPAAPLSPAAAPEPTAPSAVPAQPEDDAPLLCPGCHAPVKPDDRFCEECGRKLER